MDAILNEVKEAFRLRLYYLCIMLCLALPDICSALESDDGETDEKKYRAWVKRWLRQYANHLTPQDMYRLRCGVLHQGRMGHRGFHYKRVAFSVNFLVHNTFLPSREKPEVLTLFINLFCRDVVTAVEEWEEVHKDDPIVKRNLEQLVQFRPNGLLPYLDGVACVS